jgi:8-oxo-dGTP pyrophosphatase MutT (NUDIX family)
MKKWSQTNRKEVLRAHVFKYETVDSASADGSKSGVFDIVTCLNWVNVVAITESNEIVLVKQYRHGADDLTIETPAGAIEPGEDPLVAAKRELEEETGYISDEWSDLGSVKVNPAFMTNTCHIYLAKNCRPEGEQCFDPLEEIELVKYQVNEIEDVLDRGEIVHSLAHLSLLKFLRSSS